jgi:hypothetical protein
MRVTTWKYAYGMMMAAACKRKSASTAEDFEPAVIIQKYPALHIALVRFKYIHELLNSSRLELYMMRIREIAAIAAPARSEPL